MKQFQVETKNQVNGQWNLYDRVKCKYHIDLSNSADAEDEAKARAIQSANYVNRKHRLAGTAIVAFIEARIVELTIRPNQEPHRNIIWENGEFILES